MGLFKSFEKSVDFHLTTDNFYVKIKCCPDVMVIIGYQIKFSEQ